MNLRDLVGRMAIRTDKVREVMPWEMERAFRLDFTEMVAVLNEALRYGTAGKGKKVRL